MSMAEHTKLLKEERVCRISSGRVIFADELLCIGPYVKLIAIRAKSKIYYGISSIIKLIV